MISAERERVAYRSALIQFGLGQFHSKLLLWKQLRHFFIIHLYRITLGKSLIWPTLSNTLSQEFWLKGTPLHLDRQPLAHQWSVVEPLVDKPGTRISLFRFLSSTMLDLQKSGLCLFWFYSLSLGFWFVFVVFYMLLIHSFCLSALGRLCFAGFLACFILVCLLAQWWVAHLWGPGVTLLACQSLQCLKKCLLSQWELTIALNTVTCSPAVSTTL